MNPRRLSLCVLGAVWIIMGLISAGMLIAGKAEVFPDLLIVAAMLVALTIFQFLVLALLRPAADAARNAAAEAFDGAGPRAADSAGRIRWWALLLTAILLICGGVGPNFIQPWWAPPVGAAVGVGTVWLVYAVVAPSSQRANTPRE